MVEIKYQYAYDESWQLVDINECTKEESKCHSYRCLGCGCELRPRAIESKYKRAHFYHKEQQECNGETYLHKLGKLLVKQKFESTGPFIVSYPITKSCDKEDCTLRDSRCRQERVLHEVDLKKYYDTCSVEAPIKGFIADLLLTNSQNTSIPPTLIEICVTHPCSEEKRTSGLKVIEMKIGSEQEIRDVISKKISGQLSYAHFEKQTVEFIEFKSHVKEQQTVDILRYVYNPSIQEQGYFTRISCLNAHHKLLKDSITELNFVSPEGYVEPDIPTALSWMKENKFPQDRRHSVPFRRNYRIEEVVMPPIDTRDEYRVVIASSSSFDFEEYFNRKCDGILLPQMETHKVIMMCGTPSSCLTRIIERYSRKHSLVVEPYYAEWSLIDKRSVYKSNEEMLRYADALLLFLDKHGLETEVLKRSAKTKGLKVYEFCLD